MGWHICNDYLLSGGVPEIINAQASSGITSVSAVLNVPIHRVLLPLPPSSELVGA
jgi:hypothetical protein